MKIGIMDGKGSGIFATSPIAKGESILKYYGEKDSSSITMTEAHYVMETLQGDLISADPKSCKAALVNHCCKSFNCKMEECFAHVKDEIWLLAGKDIAVGEEMTYHHGFRRNLLFSYHCVNCLAKDAKK